MDDMTRLIQLEMGLLARRLRGMAMISRGIVPNLVVSQRVVDRVGEAAKHFIADETGETMVGLVVDTGEPETMPTLYVLDTISPDESVIRRSHMFEQGDELQQDIFLWLLDNWNTYLKIGKDMSGKPIREEWKVPLKHLGDWHKQPGFMIQPSGGDLMTALRFMDDEENDFDALLVPIVTLGHSSVTSEVGAQVNYFTVPQHDGTSLRMDWWYIHRDVRVFQPISPKIVPANELPALTPYPWHILDVDLMDEELALIEEDGMFMLAQTALPYQIDDDLPLEICFIIGRGDYNKVFIIATDWDYPDSKPRIFIAPFTGIDPSMYIYDVFDQLWQQAKPIEEPPEFTWNPESSYIVDYLAEVEKHLGMRPNDLPMPIERSRMAADRANSDGAAVNITVEIDDAGTKKAVDDEAAEQTTADGRIPDATAGVDGATGETADESVAEVETNEEEAK